MAVVLVLEVEKVVPLKLGEVYTKMQIWTTLDGFCHCTCIIMIHINHSHGFTIHHTIAGIY